MRGRARKDTTTAGPAGRRPGEGVAARGSAQGDALRVRAAWMYYVEQLTQNEIAERLGVGRITVVRLLADSRARHEVTVTIAPPLAETVALERRLETRFGIERAVVAPLSSPGADPVPVIGAAAGEYVSRLARPGMRIGVGWGRTLSASLASVRAQSLDGLKVYSLLGGIIEARRFNPAEFAWRLAELLGGEGYLVPAPAVVDSPDTRRTLVERCGLGAVLDAAGDLDAVLLSVGDVTEDATSRRFGCLSAATVRQAVRAGAAGDLLLRFFDREGRLIGHEIHDRVMSVPVERLRQVPVRVLASGGARKVDAIAGAVALVAPTVLITDEATARALCGGDEV